MTAILGISAFYHDSAAALVVDGEIVAAAQEERFTRKKHDARLPAHARSAIASTEAGLTPGGPRLRRASTKSRCESSSGCWRPTSPMRRAGSAASAWRCRSGSRRSCTCRSSIRARRRRCSRAPLVFHRPSREPRRQRVLSQPVRRGRDPDRWTASANGRTTTFGVGAGNRIRLTHQLQFPHSLGPAVFGVHLLLRLQGQQRRIQADGAGPVRAARSTRTSIYAAPDRSEARRQLLAEHGATSTTARG